MRNPDVTVRSRGVMEKCTYCVQRINRGARSRPSNEGRPDPGRRDRDRLPGRPARREAIVFGDINDPESRGGEAARRSRANYGAARRAQHAAAHDLPGRACSNPNPELEG